MINNRVSNTKSIVDLEPGNAPHLRLNKVRSSQRATITTIASLFVFVVQAIIIAWHVAIEQYLVLDYEIALAVVSVLTGLGSRFKPDSAVPAHLLLGALLTLMLTMSVLEQDTMAYLSWWAAMTIVSGFMFDEKLPQQAWVLAHLLVAIISTTLTSQTLFDYGYFYTIISFATVCLASSVVSHQRWQMLDQVKQASLDMSIAHERLREVSALESQFIAQRDPQKIMATALHYLLQNAGARYGFIAEVSPAKDNSSALRLWSLATDGRVIDSEEYPAFEMQMLAPAIANACQTTQPLLLNNITSELSGATLPGLPDPEQMANLMFFPIHRGDSLLGMVATGMGSASFTPRDQDNLVPLIHTIGMIIGSLQDRESHRLSEEALQHHHRIEALGELTGGVAHDFNNILAVQLGNMELLELHEVSLAGNEHVEAIKETIERGRTLTGQLLSFSRRQTLATESIQLSGLLGPFNDMLNRILGPHITTRLDAEPGLWNIYADRHQLEGALLNLALNARDAMPRGGNLSLIARNETVVDSAATRLGISPGNYVSLDIVDTGEGMPEHVRLRAFEPFFTTKDHGKGSGLGLSMVFGFVNQSDGHISIDSNPDGGTQITLKLPQSLAPVYEKPHNVKNHSNQTNNSSRRILIIEDEEQVLQVMADLIRDMGFEVVEAIDGKSALAAAEAHAPLDLILSDIMLPNGMNGLDIADILLEKNPCQQFLFTSGYTGESLLESRDIDLETQFIRKPFRTRELLEKIETLVTHASP